MPRVVPSQVVDLIDQFFPQAKKQIDSPNKPLLLDRAYQNELAAITELVEQIPPELITLDAKDYSALQAAVTAIKTTIPTWQNRDYPLAQIRGYGNLNPVTIIRNTLSKCPDEGVSESTSDLAFISDQEDQELRDNIRIDISSANQAFQNGEWKAATVLAGATIEALLFYVLNSVRSSDPSKIEKSIASLVSNGTFNQRPKTNLDEWPLHQLTEVALDLSLIKKETATQVRLARNFRNLIHPGVSVRKNQVCNRGTALSALAALEHVINDLSTRSP